MFDSIDEISVDFFFLLQATSLKARKDKESGSRKGWRSLFLFSCIFIYETAPLGRQPRSSSAPARASRRQSKSISRRPSKPDNYQSRGRPVNTDASSGVNTRSRARARASSIPSTFRSAVSIGAVRKMHQELVALFADRWETRSIPNTTRGSVYHIDLPSDSYI